VGVDLDAGEELRDASGGRGHLRQEAVRGEGGVEPGEHVREGLRGDVRGEAVEAALVEPGVGEGAGQGGGLGHGEGLEPIREGVLPVRPPEHPEGLGVFADDLRPELGGEADLLGRHAVLRHPGDELREAGHPALEVRHAPADGRGGVVQLVGQPGRELPEGGQLLALLLGAGALADAVAHVPDEPPPQLLARRQEAGEVLPLDLQEAAGLDHDPHPGVARHPGVREDPHEAPGAEGVVEHGLPAHVEEELDGPLEHDVHLLRRLPDPEQAVPHSEGDDPRVLGEPGVGLLGEVPELRDGLELVEGEVGHGGGRGLLAGGLRQWGQGQGEGASAGTPSARRAASSSSRVGFLRARDPATTMGNFRAPPFRARTAASASGSSSTLR
jgi:hypothetical protein